MPWIIEDLTGTKNGVNKDFTTSVAGVLDSRSIFHTAIRYRRVTGVPSGSEYAISGTNITLGRAPAGTDHLWTRVFNDA